MKMLKATSKCSKTFAKGTVMPEYYTVDFSTAEVAPMFNDLTRLVRSKYEKGVELLGKEHVDNCLEAWDKVNAEMIATAINALVVELNSSAAVQAAIAKGTIKPVEAAPVATAKRSTAVEL